jgi:hypothetical protein
MAKINNLCKVTGQTMACDYSINVTKGMQWVESGKPFWIVDYH